MPGIGDPQRARTFQMLAKAGSRGYSGAKVGVGSDYLEPKQQTLRAYLQARVQAEYRDRESETPGLVENFEAEDIPGVAPFSERRVREAIRIYFQEKGFKVERFKFLTRYRGPNGENYGITFTFIPRDHPLAPGVSHRFRVSVLDFEAVHNAMRSDKVADAALECLAEQRGKDPDHFK